MLYMFFSNIQVVAVSFYQNDATYCRTQLTTLFRADGKKNRGYDCYCYILNDNILLGSVEPFVSS